MRAGSIGHQTLGGRTSPGRLRQVPMFAGVTSGEQYQQLFDAIVLSNGWDGATAALQLLFHLEGDALNVALLWPEPRRETQVGLVGALTAHYGLAGGLSPPVREDDPEGGGGPIHLCNSVGDTGGEGI